MTLALDECVLRSTSWDGPTPDVGDLLTTRGGSWYVVLDVAQGAGLGHFRLRVLRCGKRRPVEADDSSRSIFRWTWARRTRAA